MSFAAFLKLLQDCLVFVLPTLLKKLITYLSNPGSPLWFGIILAGSIGLASILQSILLHNYFLQVYVVGMRVQSALSSSIYKKALRLSFSSRNRYTIGGLVNLQNLDTNKLNDACPYLNMLWSAPFQISVAILLVYLQIGVSVFAGLFFLFLLIPINFFVLKTLKKSERKLMNNRDQRNKVLNEVLQAIRLIKYFGWESNFEKNISNCREAEFKDLSFMKYLGSIMSFTWASSPIFVTLIAFGTYTLMGNKLVLEIAFPCLLLFNILRFPINMLPSVITSVVDCSVSIKRLQDYFLSPELQDVEKVNLFGQGPALTIRDGYFHWEMTNNNEATDILSNKPEPIPFLSDIQFEVMPHENVAVVGSIGSGKTSLLLALLGEMPISKGQVSINGNVAYVSQQAWIQNSSLLQNVTFGIPTISDRDTYNNVLHCCALEDDLKLFPSGDETEIGEKGINLSGGQKTRVSLARAMYQDADIYLLDDPFSALDAHVSDFVFKTYLLGALSKKTRLVVTHQLQYLSYFDRIIFLDKGRIIQQGTYGELMSVKGSPFNMLIDSFIHDGEHHPQEETLKLSNFNSFSQNSSHLNSTSIDESYSNEASLCSSADDRYLVDTTSDQLIKSSIESPESTKNVAEVEAKSTPGKMLIMAEERNVGSVSFDVYLAYMRAASSLLICIIILIIFGADSSLQVASNYWLKDWSESTGEAYNFLLVYTLVSISNSIMILCRNVLVVYATLSAASRIHSQMLQSLMRAPVSWFDRVPIGRVFNRFSRDQSTLDDTLPRSINMALSTFFLCFSILGVIFFNMPFVFVYSLPLIFLYRYIQNYYFSSSRELQRLNSISRSPIYAHFSETLQGLHTIRAFNQKDRFMELNEDKIDFNMRTYFMTVSANRWLGMRLEFVGACVIFFTAMYAVLSRSFVSVGVLSLTVTYAIQFTAQLNYLVRMSTDIENNLVSVERCREYSNIESEAPWDISPGPPADWPQHGAITFNHLCLRYDPDYPDVLSDITCHIAPHEKIGIVGRTGAGKSSLIVSLFRITEASAGSIEIDGIDISTIGLHRLRHSIGIIPQDPILFLGTIRSNLDPFNNFNDQQLWDVLESVSLTSQISQMSGQLDANVSEIGGNLSVGTRQLICLARSILLKPRILIMDEATASVDYETDEQIQRSIRKEFADKTVITIAHRISTITDSDRVMVMDKGCLVEFDNPSVLLQNPKSQYGLLVRSSQDNSSQLDQHFDQ